MLNPYAPKAVADLQHLTRDYASFSRSRGGLGNVLGGIIGLVVFGGVWLLGPGLPAAVLTVGLTLVWLVGKEFIRRGRYRRFREAHEAWSGTARQTHRLAMLLLTPLLLAFAVWITAAGQLTAPVAWPYLIFCFATPWILWRYLYALNEIMIGCGLLFLCAITASGHMPFLLGLTIVPAYSLAMIPLGLAEHRQFRALEVRLRARPGAEA